MCINKVKINKKKNSLQDFQIAFEIICESEYL
jgi:hypothetical protein